MRNFFVDHKQLKKSKLGEFFLYVIFSDSFTVKTVLKIGAVFGSPMDSKIAPCNFCKLCLYLAVTYENIEFYCWWLITMRFKKWKAPEKPDLINCKLISPKIHVKFLWPPLTLQWINLMYPFLGESCCRRLPNYYSMVAVSWSTFDFRLFSPILIATHSCHPWHRNLLSGNVIGWCFVYIFIFPSANAWI